MGGRCRPVCQIRPALPTHIPVPGPSEECEKDENEEEHEEEEGDDDVQKRREDSSESNYVESSEAEYFDPDWS